MMFMLSLSVKLSLLKTSTTCLYWIVSYFNHITVHIFERDPEIMLAFVSAKERTLRRRQATDRHEFIHKLNFSAALVNQKFISKQYFCALLPKTIGTRAQINHRVLFCLNILNKCLSFWTRNYKKVLKKMRRL